MVDEIILFKPYTTRSGRNGFKPSIEHLKQLDANGEGFCINCGESQSTDPDAKGNTCESCEENYVFGAAELIMRGLYF